MNENTLAHTKWNRVYHIVFIPKYRKGAIPPRFSVSELFGALGEGKSVLPPDV
jgi:REP element-mobilizing transposase RayT